MNDRILQRLEIIEPLKSRDVEHLLLSVLLLMSKRMEKHVWFLASLHVEEIGSLSLSLEASLSLVDDVDDVDDVDPSLSPRSSIYTHSRLSVLLPLPTEVLFFLPSTHHPLHTSTKT